MNRVNTLLAVAALWLASCSGGDYTSYDGEDEVLAEDAADWLADASADAYADTTYEDTYGDADCTVDCSGHNAGYAWAEENGITDTYDCGGNSQSFIEGCQAYAEE